MVYGNTQPDTVGTYCSATVFRLVVTFTVPLTDTLHATCSALCSALHSFGPMVHDRCGSQQTRRE